MNTAADAAAETATDTLIRQVGHQWVLAVRGARGNWQEYVCGSEEQAKKLAQMFLTPVMKKPRHG